MLCCLAIWLLFSLLFTTTTAAPEQHSEAEAGVRWRDLQVSTSSDGTTLLQPSSGFIPSGHLCGIIGPSGGGKSTFLAALGGVTPNHSGLRVSGYVWWEDDNGNDATTTA